MFKKSASSTIGTLVTGNIKYGIRKNFIPKDELKKKYNDEIDKVDSNEVDPVSMCIQKLNTSQSLYQESALKK